MTLTIQEFEPQIYGLAVVGDGRYQIQLFTRNREYAAALYQRISNGIILSYMHPVINMLELVFELSDDKRYFKWPVELTPQTAQWSGLIDRQRIKEVCIVYPGKNGEMLYFGEALGVYY
jgi:hypothetical protein